MGIPSTTTGQLLRALRKERGVSQEALALEAGSSSRYISFLETGRAHPSRSLLLRLAAELKADYQVQSDLLISAGYSPLQANQVSREEHEAVRSTLKKHIDSSPYPGVICDRYGGILEYNRSMGNVIESILGSSDYLDRSDANMYLLELSPELCSPYIVNLAEQFQIRLKTLHQQCLRSPDDPVFEELYKRVEALQSESGATTEAAEDHYFSRLYFKLGEVNIGFYWFYGSFGSDAGRLFEDLQVISAVPVDDESAEWFLR